MVYGVAARQQVLARFERPPDREQDGTAAWSLNMLQRALRKAPTGLPNIGTC